MKNIFGVLLTTLIATSAFAGGGNGISSSKKYAVVVSLSNTANTNGTLTAYQNVKGSDGKTTAQKLFSCPAIGSIENRFSGNDKAVKTPKEGTVWATADYILYKGEYESNMPYATYFSSSHGNPIAIHTGPLGRNSHGCVRTTSDCASKVRKLADENSTQGNRDLPEVAGSRGNPRTVSGNQMSVQVKFN